MTYLQRAERKFFKKMVFDTCSALSDRDLRVVRRISTWPFVSVNFRRRLTGYLEQFRSEKTYHVKLQDGFNLEIRPKDSLQCRVAVYGPHFRFVWEPKTARLLAALMRTGGSCVIAGGHIGYFPLLASTVLEGRSGTVYAFEPNDDQRQQLVRNVALNGRHNIVVEPFALFCEETTLSFQKDSANLRSAITSVPGHDTVRVEATTIDGYLASKAANDVTVIMLDIEGVEHEALMGARSILGHAAGSAPDLIFELVPGRRPKADQDALLAYIASLGYELFVIEDSYDHALHEPAPDESIRLHKVTTSDDVACARDHLELPDPNVYATKRSARWARESEGIVVVR